MKNRYSVVALTFAVALIGLAAFIFRHNNSRDPASLGIASPESSSADPSLITTALPVRRTFMRQVPWIGTVETQASITLTALVAGRVVAIAAEDQRQLEKGQRVMQLGGVLIEESRTKLNDEIHSLQTRVDLARQTLERLEESLKTRLVTKDQLAAAQEAEAGLEVRLLEARLSLDTLDNQVEIIAPMKGIFTNRRVSPGQDVKVGQILGDIIDPDHLRVAASLFPPPDSDLKGKEATIRLGENRTLAGTVRRILPRAGSTGSVTVWIEGPQIDTQLRPGQTVGGDIVVTIKPDALAVPASAIVYDAREHPYLFVRRGKTYEQLAIQPGLEQDGWVEVLSGLAQDQLVVTRGGYELFYRNFNKRYKVQD